MATRENATVVTVELGDEAAAEELVRMLDARDLEAAKDVDRDAVHVAAEPDDATGLEPIAAVEAWLEQRGLDAVTVHVGGYPHRVRRPG